MSKPIVWSPCCAHTAAPPLLPTATSTPSTITHRHHRGCGMFMRTSFPRRLPSGALGCLAFRGGATTPAPGPALPLLLQDLELRLLFRAQDRPDLFPAAPADLADPGSHFLSEASELLAGIPQDDLHLLALVRA